MHSATDVRYEVYFFLRVHWQIILSDCVLRTIFLDCILFIRFVCHANLVNLLLFSLLNKKSTRLIYSADATQRSKATDLDDLYGYVSTLLVVSVLFEVFYIFFFFKRNPSVSCRETNTFTDTYSPVRVCRFSR